MAPRQIEHYQLVKLLGHGSTAEVHCARHRKSKELVAIKLLHEFMTDQQTKQKFLQEAKLVEMLDHPGIIRIINAGFYQQTRPYIVMSYAPGNTLRKKHPSNIPLPFENIRSYIRQLADALAYAHQHNIIHCDLKPENVLLDKDSHLLLSDFGIARIRETTLSQTTRDAFGTATYMAPEQFRGKYHPATDQYALAIMVYEWLCGHPPFSGENHNQLMDRHMNMPVPSLREACKIRTEGQEISEEVERVILKALAKDPQARFSSIAAFAQALELALPASESRIRHDQDSNTFPTQLSIRVQSSKRRHTPVTIALVLLALGLLVGTSLSVYGWTWWNPSHRPAMPTLPSKRDQATATYEAKVNANWHIQSAHTPQNLNDVAWSDSQFVAVGDHGTILNSIDGHIWIPQKAVTPENLNSIIYAKSRFVVVGDHLTILTSSDGHTWTPQKNVSNLTAAGDFSLYKVAYAESQFVAVGKYTTVLTSSDGYNWISENANGPQELHGVTVGVTKSGPLIVAVGSYGIIFTSPDGTYWHTQQQIRGAELGGFTGIAWGNSQFVAVGIAVGSGPSIWSSPDGHTWTAQHSGGTLTNIIWTGSQFVAVGYEILTSPDGHTWTPPQYYVQDVGPGESHYLNGVAWSGSQLVAVGALGTILTSS